MLTLTELKELFEPIYALSNVSLLICKIDEFIMSLEEHLKDKSLRNAAIDAVIQILQEEKR